jgi:hypothetical protein
MQNADGRGSVVQNSGGWTMLPVIGVVVGWVPYKSSKTMVKNTGVDRSIKVFSTRYFHLQCAANARFMDCK